MAGCIEFYGKHIQLCVKDFARGYKRQLKGTFLHDFHTAEKFLFGGTLESAIHKFGLPLDAEYVKRMAIDYAENPKKYANKDKKKIDILDVV